MVYTKDVFLQLSPKISVFHIELLKIYCSLQECGPPHTPHLSTKKSYVLCKLQMLSNQTLKPNHFQPDFYQYFPNGLGFHITFEMKSQCLCACQHTNACSSISRVWRIQSKRNAWHDYNWFLSWLRNHSNIHSMK